MESAVFKRHSQKFMTDGSNFQVTGPNFEKSADAPGKHRAGCFGAWNE
jgi:hypothetical protein